jgi:hypothetical protein
MEKLKIGQTEFELVPMGIGSTDKTRSFTVVKNMEFNGFRAVILDGLTQIDHIGNDGEVANSYMDCVALKSITATNEEEQNTYTILLSTDASLQEIRALKLKNDELEGKVATQEEVIIYMQETLDTLVLNTLEPEPTESEE